MKEILTSELELGMEFDQPVFIDPYNILLQSKQAIKEEDLESLRKWGVQKLKTHGELLTPHSASLSLKDRQEESAPVSDNTSNTTDFSNYDKGILLSQYKEQYESFRQEAALFSKDLRTNCALLENSFKDFLGKNIPQAHRIEQVSDFFTEKIMSFPLLVIFLRYANFSSNWIIRHIAHATAYGILLARALGYSKADIRNVASAMLVMDLGMFRIPSSIREKGKNLKKEEIELIRKHPLLSHRLLYSATSVKSAKMANVALQHHESYDGTGYPQGLKGKSIDQNAMIAKICDNYSAMLEQRPFRKRVLPSLALKNMLSTQKNRFDPDILRAFVKEMSIYPTASFMKLNNACAAMVIATHPQKLTFPILRLMRDPQGKPYSTLRFMDLAYEKDIRIESPIAPLSVGIDPLREL